MRDGAGDRRLTERAQGLRRNPTDAEQHLWSVLRGDMLGVRFRRQHVVGGRYIADFCAPSLRLILEVDGGQHAECAGDAVRTAYLEGLGYRVVRVWNNEVLTNREGVVEHIIGVIAELNGARKGAGKPSPLTPLPPAGEGESAPAAPFRRRKAASAPELPSPASGRVVGGEGSAAGAVPQGEDT